MYENTQRKVQLTQRKPQETKGNEEIIKLFYQKDHLRKRCRKDPLLKVEFRILRKKVRAKIKSPKILLYGEDHQVLRKVG